MANQNSLEKELNQWNQVICDRPNDPQAYVRRGMVNFKLVKIDESIADFDRAEKLAPRLSPYLWQRGLSYYYAERFDEGAKQFELDLTVNAQDVEETVWRYLCIARLKGVSEAQNSLLVVKNDPRLVMRCVYELYAGNCTTDDVLAAGHKEGKRGKFYSHLYVGLYYEAEEKVEQACEYIVKAVDEYCLDDYMWHLASVHQRVRGWI
jgi:tetratricopeptide (TPR) repeat protein